MAETSAPEIRVVFWNTWLLSPRLWASGPRVPGIGALVAPDVDERAPMVAEALTDRFDVAALSEVWEPSEQHAVADAWPEAQMETGPDRRGLRFTGSGLITLAGPAVDVVQSARYRYRAGGDLRDSDSLATKGALFTSISFHPDRAPLEVISTHLFAGGDLLPVPGADDPDRHHLVRMEQIDELIGFIERTHDPDNPLLVVGDFNVAAHRRGTTDPGADRRDLAAHMDRAGLRDLWAGHGIGPGPTASFTADDALVPDPDEPDQVVDEIEDESATPGDRIDYLWFTAPAPMAVDIDRPRRWAFAGRNARGGPAGSLSDHLALSVTLRFPT